MKNIVAEINIGDLVVIKKTQKTGKIKQQLGNDGELLNWYAIEVDGNEDHYREDQIKPL